MKLTNNRGFSIAETMVSVSIFTFILAGLYTTLLASNQSIMTQNAHVNAQREVRKTLDIMSRDLRVAESLAVTQTSNDVNVTFNEPSIGTVSYVWTNDVNDPDVNRIIRQTPSASIVVASNILAISITDSTDNVTIDVTSFEETPQGQSTFQLVKKVNRR